MAKIIQFQDFKDQIEEGKEKTFQELLAKAVLLKQMSKDNADINDFKSLKKAFEIALNNFLLENKLIGSDVFMCASYIASVLAEFGGKVPDSWYMSDYILKDQEQGGDGRVIREGADTCLVLCSLYPERCDRRSMSLSDYMCFGSAMYRNYYNITGKEVTYHMSKKFRLMTEIVAECAHTI